MIVAVGEGKEKNGGKKSEFQMNFVVKESCTLNFVKECLGRETPNACGLGALQSAMHARSSKESMTMWALGGYCRCRICMFVENRLSPSDSLT